MAEATLTDKCKNSQQINSVTMYTKLLCPYCVRAKQLLQHKGVEFEEIRIDTHPEKLSEMLERSRGARTVPQIFIGAVHVGGSDELVALHRTDKLDELLFVTP